MLCHASTNCQALLNDIELLEGYSVAVKSLYPPFIKYTTMKRESIGASIARNHATHYLDISIEMPWLKMDDDSAAVIHPALVTFVLEWKTLHLDSL